MRLAHMFIEGYGGYKTFEVLPGIFLTRPKGKWLVAVPDGHNLKVIGDAEVLWDNLSCIGYLSTPPDKQWSGYWPKEEAS